MLMLDRNNNSCTDNGNLLHKAKMTNNRLIIHYPDSREHLRRALYLQRQSASSHGGGRGDSGDTPAEEATGTLMANFLTVSTMAFCHRWQWCWWERGEEGVLPQGSGRDEGLERQSGCLLLRNHTGH